MATEDNRLVEQINTVEIIKDENKIKSKTKETVIDLLPQLIASCLMYFLVIQAGISMSFSSVLITQIADNGEIELNTNSASIIASIWSLSLPLGALSSGFLMDGFGRRKTGLFICFPFTISWLIMSFAENVTMIYVARIISGITAGLTTCSVVYVAEISSKTTRSGLLCMNSVWVSFGIFLTYFLNYFNLHWRTIGYVYALMSSLCFLAIFVVPESPQWLLVFNKKENDERKRDQVKSTFSWLYRKQQISEVHYNDLIRSNEIRVVEAVDENDTNWLRNIKRPQVYKPFTILFFLFLLQQLSGGYVLIFYTLNIFRNLGAKFLNSIDERMALVLVGSIRLVMAIIAAALAQKCNRKILLYISTMGMGIFAFIASSQMLNVEDSAHSLFLRHDNNVTSDSLSSSSASNYILLLCVLSYMLFASVGILIIPWTLISELYSIKYKATFGGTSVAVAYILMSIVLKIFPFALETFSISIIFAIFGGVSLTTAIFIYFYLPETHRKTFAEIEQSFMGVKDN
ncbi:CLUMA_CG011847, isoform A [Clunio marinus]|uniref:CLUMA_CG011847, isoform A n=1 Tax=Clunio marinus TaxID=568069 RepID=A0A1J1IFG1_9DIPT|nr:CLUMA_CG011847, isoform A [Clunio marinus]